MYHIGWEFYLDFYIMIKQRITKPKKRCKERRKCLNCGQEFIAHTTVTVYCTRECSYKHRSSLTFTANCEYCGSEYTSKHKNGKYCSRDCKELSNGIDKECEYCGNKFRATKKKNKFCSVECNFKYKTDSTTEMTTCLNCGGEFRHYINSPRKYCSMVCNMENRGMKHISLKSCSVCGEDTYNETYCSMKCRDVRRRERSHGEIECKTCGKLFETRLIKNAEYCSIGCATRNEEVNRKKIETHRSNCIKKYGVPNFHMLRAFERIKTLDNVEPLFSIDEYRGKNKKHPFKCNFCNTSFEDTIVFVKDEVLHPRCTICFPLLQHISNGELEVCDYVKSIYEGYLIQNDRTIIAPLELDLVIPGKKIAIEYNGTYWHSELSGGKDKLYHLNKTNDCEKQGYHLIHLFETDWVNSPDIVRSILTTLIRPDLLTKIYARKCEIKSINSKESNEFLNKNHLQGSDNSSVRYGLYYNDELVSVMTFVKPRFSKKYEWEISRYATLLNTSVIGGANKLFKSFLTEYTPKSIVSYSDRRYFNGNVYSKLGFTMDGYTSPNYFYTNDEYNVLENRLQYQKHKLKDKLERFDPVMTEWENMQMNGYDRIWDCGHRRWIWINT